jgi:molecular chaperone HscB
MNYFELFEIPVSLIVDESRLSSQYEALQKKYHTGLFAHAGTEDRAEALEKSSMVHKGFTILNDPDNIIKYVLEIKNLLRDDEKHELPPDFLMEMMELNEGLMEGDILNIEEVETKIFQLQKSLYHEVQHIFEGYSDDTITEGQLLQVKDYYFRKKYLKGILERLEGMRNIAG